MTDNPRSRFWELVAEAQAASEAFDEFDVDSADPVSSAAFDQIEAEQTRRALELVEHCEKNGAALRAAWSDA